jgi:hypothetical protein
MLCIVAARTFNLILLDVAAREKHSKIVVRQSSDVHRWTGAPLFFSVLCANGHIGKYQVKSSCLGQRCQTWRFYAKSGTFLQGLALFIWKKRQKASHFYAPLRFFSEALGSWRFFQKFWRIPCRKVATLVWAASFQSFYILSLGQVNKFDPCNALI